MKRIILTNIGIFLAILFFVNIISYPICEWGIRHSSNSTSTILPNYKNFDDYLGFRKEERQRKLAYYPHEAWRHQPQKGKWVNVDENGFRKTIHSETPKTKNCWFLGGSVAWGDKNPDYATIPSLFAAATDTFQVANYAEVGYTVRQSMIRLTELFAADKKADLVISLDGINEIHTLCIKDLPLDSNPRVDAIKSRLIEIDEVGFKAIVRLSKALFYQIFLSNTIQLTQKVQIKLFGVEHLVKQQDYCCDKDAKRTEQIAEHLLLNWEMMHAIVAIRGGKFIAILQPTAITSKTRTDHITNKLSPIQASQIKAVYPIIQRKILERQHDWIYDLTTVFDDYPEDYIYTDVCHVSPNGNQIINDALMKYVFGIE